MAKGKKSGLRLDANFTEDVVGFALDSYLTLLSFPQFRFSIEPFSRGQERDIGADAVLTDRVQSFKPLYMQFKRPSAYPDMSSSKIIKDRKRLKLQVSPRVLHFRLRDKQPSHADYQHNMLYQLRQNLMAQNAGDAIYICPLFLDRSAYRFHVHFSGLARWLRPWNLNPWELEHILVNHRNGSINFDQIPVFHEHISIPPHATVKNAKHSYSFTERGTDLCFHSPLSLPAGASTLAKVFKRQIGDLESEQDYIPVSDATNKLFDLFSTGAGDNQLPLLPKEITRDMKGLEAWMGWGAHLKSQFDIEQFALIRWKE